MAQHREALNDKVLETFRVLGVENNAKNRRHWFHRVAWPLWQKAPVAERDAAIAAAQARLSSADEVLQEGIDALPLAVLVPTVEVEPMIPSKRFTKKVQVAAF